METIQTLMTRESRLRRLIKALRPISTQTELIRLGPVGDGGYLVPNDLEGIEACFSPGVEEISGFEKECAERDMDVYMADLTVEKPAEESEKFNFIKKFVGVTNNDSFITMDSWVNQSNVSANRDLILQMDIEGAEYTSLLAMSEKLTRRCRIMVIEFHMLDMLYSRGFYFLASKVFEKLLSTHVCVHIHPNNCMTSKHRMGLAIPPIMEFTFYRKDRFNSYSLATEFPNKLDSDNTDNPTIVLPDCWHG